MRVLALDSATTACSAALWEDGRVRARRLSPMARGQAEALLPMVEQVMAEGGRAFADLDLIAVTVGPGTFTGIRIGLAAARGLALVSGRPLAGIATTDAVAAAIPDSERRDRTLLVALESKRDDLWVQTFAADLTPLAPVAALAPEVAATLIAGPVLLAGDAADRIAPLMAGAALSSGSGFPDAAVIAPLAARRWQDGAALPPNPLYLRPADVTLPSRPPPPRR
jgi:tRNA threonylcarbamoyladenosine biosynthesis protein TsaB